MIPEALALLASIGAPAQAAPTPTLSAADSRGVFQAAGFAYSRGAWRTDCDQADGPPYEPGRIEQVADLNGDGRPEAIVVEGSLFCYGGTGTGFMLVSKQASGKWTKLHASPGVPTLLPTRANGWREIEVGGPGFCFPVLRWTGKTYAVARRQYEGKACRK